MNTEENIDSHSDEHHEEHHDALSLEQVLEEGKRRGYVRRADLEAAVRRDRLQGAHTLSPDVSDAEDADTLASPDTEHNEQDEADEYEAAVELLLDADVDIIDSDDEVARVEEDEMIENNIRALETEDAPTVAETPAVPEVSPCRLSPILRTRRYRRVAHAPDDRLRTHSG